MSKKTRHKKRKQAQKRQQILKISVAVFLIVAAATIFITMCHKNDNMIEQEVRGVWISYGDFNTLGLYNKSEEEFRKNAESFFELAEEYEINTIYFHTRAFRDAVYDSDNFPTAKYLWDRPEPIGYDALSIMVQLAHDHDMELHAWMNPYRNTSFDNGILDPGDEASTEEILLCVKEVLDNYDVDGIHFDDYFYEEENLLDNQEKMDNVNAMVKSVYDSVHNAGRELVFGISPAGNVSYCESIGADVKTWLSEEGYVDYVIPQIYWTDQHTAPWRENMFSDTLDEWIGLNERNVNLYVGLAAYKAGAEDETDPGWIQSQSNLADQISQVKEKGCDGYVFFSASDLYREGAEEEFINYRNLVL